jgi:hypothetical protein
VRIQSLNIIQVIILVYKPQRLLPVAAVRKLVGNATAECKIWPSDRLISLSAILDKLTVAQLFKKVLTLYGIRNLIPAFVTPQHWVFT